MASSHLPRTGRGKPEHDSKGSSMPLGTMPVVDYERHPAFEGMRAGNDTEAEALVAEIDAAYAQLVAKAPYGLSLEAAFDRDIAPKFDGLTDRLAAGSRPRFHPYLKQAMD